MRHPRFAFISLCIASVLAVSVSARTSSAPPTGAGPISAADVKTLLGLRPPAVAHLAVSPTRTVTLRAKRVQTYSPQMTAVYGTSDSGRFSLVNVEGELSGTIRDGRQAYRILRDPKGAYAIETLGVRAAMAERFTRKARGPRHHGGRPSRGPAALAEEAPRIDILVFYTTQAKNDFKEEGETDAQAVAKLKAAIGRAFVITNTTFANSALNVTANSVGIVEVPKFVETGDSNDDLDRIALKDDGKEYRPLRAQHSADIVMLIRSGGDMDGISYELESVNSEDVDYYRTRGYGAIRSTCIAQGYYCFTHELGHLLGAGHDFTDYVDENGYKHLRLHPDAYGYDLVDSAAMHHGTMMSYAGADNRIFYFSNPDVKFMGIATGIKGKRDNARAVRDGAKFVASYY